MKRTLLLVAGLLLLTGCGNKVTCTKDEEIEGGKTSETVILKFNGEKISYLENTAVATYDDKADADTEMESAEFLKSMMTLVGFECEIKQDGNKITITYSADEEALTKLAEEGTTEYNMNKDDYITSMKDEGYTCK